MTIAQLIEDLLLRIRQNFYQDRTREFMRDQRSLMKAIARYGYECHQRGWEFDLVAIQAELVGLLYSIIEKRAEIKYLPIYLEGAVDRHVRTRAEELSAAAGKIGSVTRRAMQGLQPVEVIRQPTAVEMLNTLYRDLRRRRRTPLRAVRQEALL